MKKDINDICHELEKMYNSEIKDAMENEIKQLKKLHKEERQMRWLEKDREEILKQIIDNDKDFPKVLTDMFFVGGNSEAGNLISDEADTLLREKLAELIDEGYITLEWAENLPYGGRIEQKARSYFPQKEILIRGKLKQDPYFQLLDDECENTLKKLGEFNNSTYNLIHSGFCSEQILKYLCKFGYISFGRQGIVHMVDGAYNAMVMIEQKGKNYFKDKEYRIEEIILCGDSAMAINIGKQEINNASKFVGFENCTDMTGCKAGCNEIKNNQITNSPMQFGDNNSLTVEYNFAQIEKELDTVLQNAEQQNLSAEKLAEIVEAVQMAKDSCKKKKGERLKVFLKEIYDIGKSVGSGLLTACLASIIGL